MPLVVAFLADGYEIVGVIFPGKFAGNVVKVVAVNGDAIFSAIHAGVSITRVNLPTLRFPLKCLKLLFVPLFPVHSDPLPFEVNW
jgi:hypothetical protein